MTDRATIDGQTGDRTDISVRAMTPTDFSLVDGLLADAFSRNSSTRLMFGKVDPRSRLRILNRRMIRNRHGSGLIAEVDGTPAGALLTSDHPHCEPDGIAGFGFMLDAVRTMRFRIFTSFGLFRDAARNHPKWPHRHLTVLGVSSAFQRSGVGSALTSSVVTSTVAPTANSITSAFP